MAFVELTEFPLNEPFYFLISTRNAIAHFYIDMHLEIFQTD